MPFEGATGAPVADCFLPIVIALLDQQRIDSRSEMHGAKEEPIPVIVIDIKVEFVEPHGDQGYGAGQRAADMTGAGGGAHG